MQSVDSLPIQTESIDTAQHYLDAFNAKPTQLVFELCEMGEIDRNTEYRKRVANDITALSEGCEAKS